MKDVAENNWKKAFIIEGSDVMDNYNGTAPGLIVKTERQNGAGQTGKSYADKIIILLPGPPNELIPMFE